MMNADDLLRLAHRAKGPLYANRLRARIEIARRGGPHAVPQAWLARYAEIEREYWAAQGELVREYKKFKRGAMK